jgi:hypothetical protein
MWPKKAQVGGFPAKIRYGMRALAPQGTRSLLAKLRAQVSTCTQQLCPMLKRTL